MFICIPQELITRHGAWLLAGGDLSSDGRLVVEKTDLVADKLPARACLDKARFIKCRVSGENWSGASFDHAEFIDCTITDADLSGVSLLGARFQDCVADGIQLVDADMPLVEVRGGSFAGARLDRARLGKSEWVRVKLAGAVLRDASLSRAMLEDCDLRDATLSHADARGAKLHHVDLRGARVDRLSLNNSLLDDVAVANLSGHPLIGEQGISGMVDISTERDGGQRVPAASLEAAWLVEQHVIADEFGLRFREDQVPEWTGDIVMRDLSARARETAKAIGARLQATQVEEAISLLRDAAGDSGHPLLGRLMQATIVDWGAPESWPAQRHLLELVAEELDGFR